MKVSCDESYKIQICRGVAIIAVVIIHTLPLGLAQVWCRPLVNFAVGMFLFLSGMLSSTNGWNPKKRILKVIIPYIIWTFIYVLINNINSFNFLLDKFLYNLLTGHNIEIMYYIFVYCQFNLLIPLINKLARSKYWYVGFIISPIEIIFMRMLPVMFGYEFNQLVDIIINISCLGWFIYFYLGFLIGNKLLKIKFSTRKLSICYLGSIFLQILEGYWYYSIEAINAGTQLKLSAILTGVIFVLLGYCFIKSKYKIKINWLYVLGNCSFGIYFSHLAIINIFDYILGYYKYIKFPINSFLVIVISFVFVIVGRKVFGKYSKYLALW